MHSAAYQDAAPSTQGLGAGPVPLATVRRRPDAPRGGDPHSIQRGSAPGAGSDDDDVALDGATLAALRAALPGTPLRRFLCSATLTRNPQKLAALALHNPMYFMARGEVGWRPRV